MLRALLLIHVACFMKIHCACLKSEISATLLNALYFILSIYLIANGINENLFAKYKNFLKHLDSDLFRLNPIIERTW